MTNKNEVILQKDITDTVTERVIQMQSEGLALPKNYDYSNALKSAFFTIDKVQDRNKQPALMVCDKGSVANSLLNMVIQGLTPAKTQCYFVVYGTELQLQRSYFGTQAVLKRLNNVKDIWAEVVHEGDTFEIGSDRGRTVVKEFEPKFENQDNPIVGTFAVIEKNDGELVYTIMTKKEIDQSWSKTRSGGKVQKEFPQEMAKRTVINRAAKAFINTSDDSDLLTQSINDTTSNEFEEDNKPRKQAEPVKVQRLEEKMNMQPKAEPKQAESVETPEQEVEPEQEELFSVPNFGRDEGVKHNDDSEEDYPF